MLALHSLAFTTLGTLPIAYAEEPVCSCQSSEIPSEILPLEISALYPNPVDGEEWVELHNPNSASIDLSIYTLEDTTAKAWTPSGTLASNSSKQIKGFSFQLNNGGDTVTLKDINGNILDTLSYSSSESGETIYANEERSDTRESPAEDLDPSTPSL